jgi:hypothetical protein
MTKPSMLPEANVSDALDFFVPLGIGVGVVRFAVEYAVELGEWPSLEEEVSFWKRMAPRLGVDDEEPAL